MSRLMTPFLVYTSGEVRAARTGPVLVPPEPRLGAAGEEESAAAAPRRRAGHAGQTPPLLLGPLASPGHQLSWDL